MKIHLLGIVGKMTTPLAVALKQQGHTITGSDQEKIYPPSSTILHDNHIPINTTAIDSHLDLVIVGSAYQHFQRTQAEFSQVKKMGLPYISATEYLSRHIVKDNSIVVAGSHGKTTITALVVHFLNHLKINPAYFFGDRSLNQIPSLQFSTTSSWSVIEGDESINGLDSQAKFFYYRPKYLILTSVFWEHKDSYPTAKDNLNAYRQLINSIPQTGLIVYNPNDPQLCQLIHQSAVKAVAYREYSFTNPLVGDYNRENINSALTLIDSLGFDTSTAIESLSSFAGISRRLEVIKPNPPLVIDDFAQSAPRVRSALTAIKQTYPHLNLKVFFEPHASFLQQPESIPEFTSAFDNASEVVLSKINFLPHSSTRVTAADWKKAIGSKLVYLPLASSILEHYQKTLTSADVLVHFSSGGQEGINLLSQIAYTKP